MNFQAIALFPISTSSLKREKVIHSRLNTHLESFSALSHFQSAYRKFHSTETALLRIHNDLNLAMNKQRISALILLDLSAAFDTINHDILLNRLKSCFDIADFDDGPENHPWMRKRTLHLYYYY